MEIRDLDYHSPCMGRLMHVRRYGHYGVPILAFPCQNSGARNLEEFGLIDAISDFIEEGRIKLYCVDSMDDLTLSGSGPLEERSYYLEQYYHAIADEVLPLIDEDCKGHQMPYAFGISAGGIHASILFFRRPELFSGLLSLSSIYDTSRLYGGFCDQRLYENNPLAFLRNMPSDHPYIPLYNARKIFLCVGTGAWENETLEDTRAIERVFQEKGIRAFVDFWGYDVSHDWPWWKKEVRYFLPMMLG